MSEKPVLRTEAGVPVPDNQNAQTAGSEGPLLLQDHAMIEKLARFNRERIPERVVHAVGSAAFGHLEVTATDLGKWTKMRVFEKAGKKTPAFLRMSTVAGSMGSADTARDPRGFALKFYTEDGNWDLVGNNTPIFFIRDGMKFPDFIHSQKPDPLTHRQEPDNVWDFFSLSPEATHQFTWLFGDRGIPASLRHMDGFGSHSYQWINAKGERFWVKFHFKTQQGIKTLTSEEAAVIGGRDPQALHKDLYDAISRRDFPAWTLKVQVMPEAEAAQYRFNPFDVTKVWPFKDYPLIPIAKLVLDRVPENYFASTEQAAFNPGNFVPGIGPSPDRMLQARLFAYGDAQRHRLGVNHSRLDVNAPKGAAADPARNYGRDGAMRFDANGGSSKNYEPNSFGGPAQTGQEQGEGVAVEGWAGRHPRPLHQEDNDYSQAGALYRLQPKDAQARLVENIAASLAQVSREGIIERSIGHFAKADAEFGRRLSGAVADKLRS